MRRALAALAALALPVAACSGGGDGGTTPPPAPPVVTITLPAYGELGRDVIARARAEGVVTGFAFTAPGAFVAQVGGDAVRLSYTEIGEYIVRVEATNVAGLRASAQSKVRIVNPARGVPPAPSGSIVRTGDATFAALNTDAGELTAFEVDADGRAGGVRRVRVCAGPKNLSRVSADTVVVACRDDDTVAWVNVQTPAVTRTVRLDYGAAPLGIAAAPDGAVYVGLSGPGRVLRIGPDGTPGAAINLPDPGAVAHFPSVGTSHRLLVARLRSTAAGAELYEVSYNTTTGAFAEPIARPIAPERTPSSDTEIAGVPTWLSQIAVSNAAPAAVPAPMANTVEGRGDKPNLLFDTTLRASVSLLIDDAFRTKQFDVRGMPQAAVYTSRGDFLFVVHHDARTIDRLDMLTDTVSGSIVDTGFGPDGAALTADDRFIVVNAQLAREARVYGAVDFSVDRPPTARVPTVSAEPLSAVVLRGKQLFNDSLDVRLSREAYVSCAGCHLDGRADGLVWGFRGRGEGLRNTIDLLGKRGTGHGPIHWSGNFDEVHDFEGDIRKAAAGEGLLTDDQWNQGTVQEPLGDPKAGLSPDLDALSAYVSSLDTYPKSPHRTAAGALTAAALRGKAVLERPALRCLECHAGPAFTDSAFGPGKTPNLHDVGTLTPASGNRLGGPLAGIDTPTLHNLWSTAPYFHDGSADHLRGVLTRGGADNVHGAAGATLTPAELDDLVAYLLSLDGRAD